MNLLLQGDDLNLITTRAVVCPFVKKPALFSRNLARREFHQFPNLCAMKEKAEIQGDEVEAYCQHLDMLYQDFSVGYEDVLGMEVPSWEELMELQTNDELKVKFKNCYQAFWMQRRIAESYPSLWSVVSSTVMDLLTKKRNRLQIATRGDLRLRLTNMNPNVSKLVSPRQSHSSH
uniref:Uncharacterized protein n=1 Tax=Trichuris muris TaxID=70415 RepID=A0A5S6Q754_TRIMR